MRYSHDSEPTRPDLTLHRYASCNKKHSWFFTSSATEANPIDTAGLKFFKKDEPRARTKK